MASLDPRAPLPSSRGGIDDDDDNDDEDEE
jgi:hypothetical protein